MLQHSTTHATYGWILTLPVRTCPASTCSSCCKTSNDIVALTHGRSRGIGLMESSCGRSGMPLMHPQQKATAASHQQQQTTATSTLRTAAAPIQSFETTPCECILTARLRSTV
eukprot:jgi/Chlat1/4389/Chrsp29S04538